MTSQIKKKPTPRPVTRNKKRGKKQQPLEIPRGMSYQRYLAVLASPGD